MYTHLMTIVKILNMCTFLNTFKNHSIGTWIVFESQSRVLIAITWHSVWSQQVWRHHCGTVWVLELYLVPRLLTIHHCHVERSSINHHFGGWVFYYWPATRDATIHTTSHLDRWEAIYRVIAAGCLGSVMGNKECGFEKLFWTKYVSCLWPSWHWLL